MSSLSRTYARESRRTHGLMQQYQQPGTYAWAEQNYKDAQAKKKAQREARRGKSNP